MLRRACLVLAAVVPVVAGCGSSAPDMMHMTAQTGLSTTVGTYTGPETCYTTTNGIGWDPLPNPCTLVATVRYVSTPQTALVVQLTMMGDPAARAWSPYDVSMNRMGTTDLPLLQTRQLTFTFPIADAMDAGPIGACSGNGCMVPMSSSFTYMDPEMRTWNVTTGATFSAVPSNDPMHPGEALTLTMTFTILPPGSTDPMDPMAATDSVSITLYKPPPPDAGRDG